MEIDLEVYPYDVMSEQDMETLQIDFLNMMKFTVELYRGDASRLRRMKSILSKYGLALSEDCYHDIQHVDCLT
jgi:hypothetical protein